MHMKLYHAHAHARVRKCYTIKTIRILYSIGYSAFKNFIKNIKMFLNKLIINLKETREYSVTQLQKFSQFFTVQARTFHINEFARAF